jgi:DNA helicase HerA-like ATPase
VTQNPLDIPETVLGQLGNRIQHALRAFTPRDQKAVKSAAETFRANPAFDTAKAVTELGVGEALVSMLESAGTPSVVERALIAPPRARIGPASAAERQAVIERSPVAGKYDEAVDRDSAYERLQTRAASAPAREAPPASSSRSPWEQPRSTAPRRGSSRQGVGEAFAKSAVRAIGSQVGRQIVRGVLGALFRR